MKIAYIDLNDVVIEDYSLFPKRYGGGRIFAAKAKEELNKNNNIFHIFADKKCFSSINKNSENISCCFELPLEIRKFLVQGAKIKDYIPNADQYDLFVHHHSSYHLNLDGLKAKEFCWVIGYLESINPEIENIGFFNIELQNCKFNFANHNVYRTIISPPKPIYENYKKMDYLFFCGKFADTTTPEFLIKTCLEANIPLFLAGKLDENYNWIGESLMNDKNCVKYLGEISEENKIDLLKHARATAILHRYCLYPGSLGGIQAQMYGCPIIANHTPWWDGYIINGINGFVINLDEPSELIEAYYKCNQINPENCYNATINYNEKIMMKDFIFAFNDIINKNK